MLKKGARYFSKLKGAKYLKVENRQIMFLNKMGAKYFSPILKVKIDKYKKANYLQGVANYLRRGGKRRGAKNGGRIWGRRIFTKKHLSI